MASAPRTAATPRGAATAARARSALWIVCALAACRRSLSRLRASLGAVGPTRPPPTAGSPRPSPSLQLGAACAPVARLAWTNRRRFGPARTRIKLRRARPRLCLREGPRCGRLRLFEDRLSPPCFRPHRNFPTRPPRPTFFLSFHPHLRFPCHGAGVDAHCRVPSRLREPIASQRLTPVVALKWTRLFILRLSHCIHRVAMRDDWPVRSHWKFRAALLPHRAASMASFERPQVGVRRLAPPGRRPPLVPPAVSPPPRNAPSAASPNAQRDCTFISSLVRMTQRSYAPPPHQTFDTRCPVPAFSRCASSLRASPHAAPRPLLPILCPPPRSVPPFFHLIPSLLRPRAELHCRSPHASRPLPALRWTRRTSTLAAGRREGCFPGSRSPPPPLETFCA